MALTDPSVLIQVIAALLVVACLSVAYLYSRVLALEKSLQRPEGSSSSSSSAAASPVSGSAIDVTALTTVRPLAAGSTAGVWLAEDAAGAQFALKVVPKTKGQPTATVTALAAERAALAACGEHPLIASCVGACHDVQHVYLALELASGGDLHHLLHTVTPEGKLPASQAKAYTACLAAALGHVHGLGLIHGDVSLENVVVAHDGSVKLTDFGAARKITPTVNGRPHANLTADRAGSTGLGGLVSDLALVVSHLCGRTDKKPDASALTSLPYAEGAYAAPEVVRGGDGTDDPDSEALVTPALDYWALGVLAFELLTGRVPFEGRSLAHTHAAVAAYAHGGSRAKELLTADLLIDANIETAATAPAKDAMDPTSASCLSTAGARLVVSLLEPDSTRRLGTDMPTPGSMDPSLVQHAWFAEGAAPIDVAALRAGAPLAHEALRLLIPSTVAAATLADDADADVTDELMASLFDQTRGVLRTRASPSPADQAAYDATFGPPMPRRLLAQSRPGAERVAPVPFIKTQEEEEEVLAASAAAQPLSPPSVYATPCPSPAGAAKFAHMTTPLYVHTPLPTPLASCALTGKTSPCCGDDGVSDASPRTDARRRTGRTSRLRRRGNLGSRESRESKDNECNA